jgi:ABC-2 type transport system ATP-binding protein
LIPDNLSPGQTPIISIQNLTKRYQNKYVVNQANLTVMPGDVFGLLGPNGAGKTTIIRMMLGLVRPTSGRALIFGADILTDRKLILGKTSAIVEAPALYPHLTGWENMKVMSYSAGITDIQKMRQALSQMGMLDRANDKFQTYSLGMKQRLCIAAALMTDPQLIILDEPTNGLDPAGIQSIRELIKSLAGQGRTVFLSSHLLNEVQQVCNRVAIIERGRIIAQGLVEEMLSSQNFIQLRLAPEEYGPAAQALQKLEFARNPRPLGEYLVVDGAANRGGEINRVLAQAGIYPSEIIPRHLSLEEFFLSVTNQPPMLPPGYPSPQYGPPPGYPNQQYGPPPGYPNQPPMTVPGYPNQPYVPPPGYPKQPPPAGASDSSGGNSYPTQGGPGHV